MARAEYEPRDAEARILIAAAIHTELLKKPDYSGDIDTIMTLIAARMSGLFGPPVDDLEGEDMSIEYWYANDSNERVKVIISRGLVRQEAKRRDIR